MFVFPYIIHSKILLSLIQFRGSGFSIHFQSADALQKYSLTNKYQQIIPDPFWEVLVNFFNPLLCVDDLYAGESDFKLYHQDIMVYKT